jgi:hypothetical protein
MQILRSFPRKNLSKKLGFSLLEIALLLSWAAQFKNESFIFLWGQRSGRSGAIALWWMKLEAHPPCGAAM